MDLLGDIFVIFAATPQVDWMKSADLCQALVDTPDRPWSEIQRGGKALSTNGLARRLKPFGVRPEKRRQRETTPNGYHVASFAEAFDRCLSQPPPSPLGALEQVNKNKDLHDSPLGTQGVSVTNGECSNPAELKGCSSVPSGNTKPVHG